MNSLRLHGNPVARRSPTPRPQLDPELMTKLTQVSKTKSLALIAGVYAAVVGLAWLGGAGSHYWLAPLAIVLIAGLQHHLATLLHDGAHFLLHPNRRVNDLIAEIFCAIPFFTSVRGYRVFHLAHHRHSGSREKDPEILFYAEQGFKYEKLSRGGLVKLLLSDLFLVNLARSASKTGEYLREQEAQGNVDGPSWQDALLNLAVWAAIVVPAVAFGFWKDLLLFWVLPSLTVLFLLLKLHGYGEHTGSEGPTEYQRTFIHEFGPVAKFFLYPIGSAFHLEHHLLPMVPWYSLRRAHRLLLEKGTVVGGARYSELVAPVTVDGYFIGQRTILKKVLSQ